MILSTQRLTTSPLKRPVATALVVSLLLVSGTALAGAHTGNPAPQDADTNPKQHGHMHHCDAHQAGEHAHGHHGEHPIKHQGTHQPKQFASELNLSDTQKQDLLALMQLYQPRLEDIRKRGQAQRLELLRMRPDDPRYGALTDSVAAEAARSATEVIVLLAELQTNTYGVLNTEQQEQFDTLRVDILDRLEEFSEKMANRDRSGRPDGYGPMGYGPMGKRDGKRRYGGKHHHCAHHDKHLGAATPDQSGDATPAE